MKRLQEIEVELSYLNIQLNARQHDTILSRALQAGIDELEKEHDSLNAMDEEQKQWIRNDEAFNSEFGQIAKKCFDIVEFDHVQGSDYPMIVEELEKFFKEKKWIIFHDRQD